VAIASTGEEDGYFILGGTGFNCQITSGLTTAMMESDNEIHPVESSLFQDFECGQNYDFLLMRIDKQGSRRWEKTFSGGANDAPQALLATPDGGVIMLGNTLSFGAGGYDIWLIKTDADGNKLWEKTFGGPNDDFGVALLAPAEGGWLIAGTKDISGSSQYQAWLIRLDEAGNLLWEKTLEYETGQPCAIRSATIGADGYPVIAGWTSLSSSNKKIWTSKIDSASGDPLWSTTIDQSSSRTGPAIFPTRDGGLVLLGESTWMLKIDTNGNILWNKSLATGQTGLAGMESPDGRLLIGGYSHGDMWLLQTDAQGIALSQATTGTKNRDQITSITLMPDGTVLSLGQGNERVYYHGSEKTLYDEFVYYDEYESALWLVKFDPSGHFFADVDGDKVIDREDICPLDACNDRDHDEVCGEVDTCPAFSNTNQIDSNDDGKGDVCEDLDSTWAHFVTTESWEELWGFSGEVLLAQGDHYIAAGYSLHSAFSCDQSFQPTTSWVIMNLGVDYLLGGFEKFSGSNPKALANTPDGSFVLLAQSDTNEILLQKGSTDNGWRKTFGGSEVDKGVGLAVANDGAIFILASTTSFGGGGNDFWLIKTDPMGNLLWDKTFGGNGDETARAIVHTSDDALILTGTIPTTSGSLVIWLVKLDTNGDIIWEKILGADEGISSDVMALAVASDGSIVLGGSFWDSSDYQHGLLIKTDANGQLQWEQKTNTSPDLMSVTSDGGIMLTRGRVLSKFNTNGAFLGSSTLGNSSTSLRAMLPGKNGGVVLTGSITKEHSETCCDDPWDCNYYDITVSLPAVILAQTNALGYLGDLDFDGIDDEQEGCK
jgi:hypothetical protein